MQRLAIPFAVLSLLAPVLGCATELSQVKSEGASAVKHEAGTLTRSKDVKIQQRDGTPILLVIPKYNDTRTKIVEEQALLCSWDVKTGGVSFEERPSPIDKFVSDSRFMKTGDITAVANEDGTVLAYAKSTYDVPVNGGIIQQAEVFIETQNSKGTADKPNFRPPLPSKASGPHLLLAYGDPTNFNLLAGYDDYSKNRVDSGLMLGNFNGSDMRWKKIKGSCPSLVAAYTPDAIKVDNRIFIDAKTGSAVKVIDLNNDALEMADYEPANRLINEFANQTRDVNDAAEIAPPSFGAYQDKLLVTVGGNYQIWIWALQNDKCASKIRIDTKKKKLTSYKGASVMSEKIFSEEPGYVRLPRREPGEK